MKKKDPCVDEMNPKDLLGVKKSPVHLVPPALVIETAPAMANGADKYGPYNWREKEVKLSVYIAAAQRHLMAYWDGEDVAEDSGVNHLAHVAACIAIVLDAAAIGKLVDDRPPAGGAPALLARQDKTAPRGDRTGNTPLRVSSPNIIWKIIPHQHDGEWCEDFSCPTNLGANRQEAC